MNGDTMPHGISPTTMAIMTLDLAPVRAIPALTGDMRPRDVAASPVTDIYHPGVHPAEVLPIAPGLVDALAGEV